MNKNSNPRSLVMLTALIAIVILVAAWFLLVSPMLTSASEANANAEEQENTNSNTEVEVNKLRAQFANMDQYQAQLTSLQVQIPVAPGYADLQRMFSAIANEHHVVITSLQFGTAAEMAQDAAAADDGSTDTSSPAPSPTPAPTAGDATADGSGTSAPSLAKLYAIPVNVAVTGAYDDVMSALKELQTGTGRIVLITTVTLTAPNSATAGTPLVGVPAGETGVFSGSTFVLTSSTPTEQPGSAASPSPSPTPTP